MFPHISVFPTRPKLESTPPLPGAKTENSLGIELVSMFELSSNEVRPVKADISVGSELVKNDDEISAFVSRVSFASSVGIVERSEFDDKRRADIFVSIPICVGRELRSLLLR
jgi:hypothetical protein